MFLKWLCCLMFAMCIGSVVNAQNAKDTSLFTPGSGGIPNSGNTLPNNNGPESPHTSFPVQSTDPGPLFHSPPVYDTIPRRQNREYYK